MPTTTNRRLTVLGGIVAVAAALLCCTFWPWRLPPQIGADAEVFDTVDALFTAVTAKDERRLSECARRLGALRNSGKLPRDAADALDAIILEARSGAWESAAERLYDFMRGQRR